MKKYDWCEWSGVVVGVSSARGHQAKLRVVRGLGCVGKPPQFVTIDSSGCVPVMAAGLHASSLIGMDIMVGKENGWVFTRKSGSNFLSRLGEKKVVVELYDDWLTQLATMYGGRFEGFWLTHGADLAGASNG